MTARARELSLDLRERLEAIPGLNGLTPKDEALSGAMASFVLDRGEARAVVARMHAEHQVVLKLAQSTCARCEEGGLPKKSYNAIRFSTHVFNDENDIDRAAAPGRLLAEA